MLRFTYRMLRSASRRIDKALCTPTAREQWIAGCDPTCVIHPDIEFKGRPPDHNLLTLGKSCILERGLSFWLSDDEGANPRLALGDHVYLGRNTFLGSYQPVTIGDHALIGAYSYIISGTHRSERRDIPIPKQGFTGAPIAIGEGAWLGTRVVVLPGATIGQGAIIGAGSVVTKNVPAYEVWAGAPARFLKKRP